VIDVFVDTVVVAICSVAFVSNILVVTENSSMCIADVSTVSPVEMQVALTYLPSNYYYYYYYKRKI